MTFRTVSGKVACNPVPGRTNLVPNPSFRGTSGTLEVRRNLWDRPRLLYTGSNGIADGLGAYAYLGATGTYSCAGGVQTYSNVTIPATGARFGINKAVSVTPTVGKRTVSIDYTITGGTGARVRLYIDSSQSGTWKQADQVFSTATSGRLSLTVNDAAGIFTTLGIYVWVESINATDAGITATWSKPLVELADAVLPYFDGTTAAVDGLTYSWSGTADASPAIATGKALARWGNVAAGVKGWQGADGVSQRMLVTKDLPAFSASLAYTTQGWPVTADAPNGSALFTVSADRAVTLRTSILCYTGGSTVETRSADTAVNTAPVTIKVQGTVPGASADTWRTALYPVGVIPAGTNLTVTQAAFEAAPTIGSFFDGNTFETGTNAYRWSGVADASASEQLVKRKPSLLSIDGVTWRTLTEVPKRVNRAANPAARLTSGTTEARRNLITNPSFEGGVSGWLNDTGLPTLGASFEQAKYGTQSLKAVSTVAGNDIAVRTSVNVTAGTTYTLSWWVFTPDARSCSVDIAGVYTATAQGVNTAQANIWTQMSTTFTATSTGSITMYFHNRYASSLPIGTAVYLDGVMLEAASAALPYFDGSTAAAAGLTYSWTGTAHASASIATGNKPAQWISNGNSAYVVPDGTGKPWVRALPGKWTYAGGSGQIGRYYAASFTLRGTPGESINIASTDNVVGSWCSTVSEVIPPSGVMRVVKVSTNPLAGTSINLGPVPSASSPDGVYLTDILIEEVGGPGQAPAGAYFDGSTPTATRRNLVPNPSFTANDFNGWTTVSAALNRVAGGADGWVGKVTQTTAGGVRQGAIAQSAFDPGTYSVSVDAASIAPEVTGLRVLLYDHISGISRVITATQAIAPDGVWRRFTFNGLVSTGAFTRVYFDFQGANIPIGAITYVDRALVEMSATASTYFDGDSPAANGNRYGWEGAASNSASYETPIDYTYAWAGTANASDSLANP